MNYDAFIRKWGEGRTADAGTPCWVCLKPVPPENVRLACNECVLEFDALSKPRPDFPTWADKILTEKYGIKRLCGECSQPRIPADDYLCSDCRGRLTARLSDARM